MNSTDTLIVLTSLLVTGTWLLYRLDGLQWLPKINDKKRILIPSLLFLSSPFIAEWLFSSVKIQKVEELTRPLIPLLTFILGQQIASR
jgi:hypothetical protein